MTGIPEIKQAIMSLSEADYAELRRWLLDIDWERWEQEFAEDVRAGKLDTLADEALEANASRNLKDLLLAPEARTDSLTPPRQERRRRAPLATE